MNLRTITNHYGDFHVLDLDPSAARGPFAVAQEGCAPGDDTARVKVFVLRRDGLWADVAYYLAGGGREKLEEILFLNTSDVMRLLQRLDGRPKVAEVTATEEEILAWHRANPQIEPGLKGLLRWASEFRRRSLQKA